MTHRSWIWLIALVFTGGIAGVVVHLRHATPPQEAQSSLAPVAAPAPADVPLPPAAESDAKVREALSPISPRDLFHEWLAQDHLLDRLVVVTDNLAEDRSPIAQLGFLRPSRPFSVSHKGSHLVISPRSQARYDAFANVVSSLDDKKVAAAYRLLHPLLESAYHALGYPGHPLDAAVTQALQRVADTPTRDDASLRPAGANYAFADPALESLGAVEKQFLRMGPRNTRLLQGEARELATALGLPLQGPPQAAH
jgi:hypothetical protein